MKLKKLLSLAAASALVFATAVAAPLTSFADYGYYDWDTDTYYYDNYSGYGYIYLDCDEMYLSIPSGSSSVSDYLTVQYVEDLYSTLTWSSSNTSVATVDSNGRVTGWSQGSAIITVRSDGGSVGRCLVYVTKDKSSRLNKSYLYMDIEYNNTQPRAQLYLSEAADFDGISQWRSSNPAVASVDRNGNVTAYQEGVATIYATTYRSGTLSCTVTVQNNIGRVTLNESRLYLESIGAQGKLNASVAVANPASVPITWTSSNPAAAIVDSTGLVTAVGDGQAIITATSSEGRKDTCKVYTGSVGVQKKKEASSFFGLGSLFQDLFD